MKIDRAFIEELGDGQKSSTLAEMILQMTAALGVTSVAEGIERSAQLSELRRLGCDLGQGHLLSRPMEAAELGRRLGVPELHALAKPL